MSCYLYLLAKIGYVVSFHEPEVSEGDSGGELPAFAGPKEGTLQLLHQVEEAILVGEGTAAVSSARVLPVKVQTIEVVFLQEVYKQNKYCLEFNTFSLAIINDVSTNIFLPIYVFTIMETLTLKRES